VRGNLGVFGARPGRPRLAQNAALLLLLALITGLNSSAGAADRAPAPFEDRDAEECLEAVPAAASVADVTDDGRQVVLDVHLVLDGIPTSRAQEIIDQAQYAYDPLGITLRATYQEVSFPPQKMAREFELSEPVPASDPSYLFQKTKEAVGGVRPANSDVVYLLTDDAITGSTAGVADCIGGVRYPNRAFGIGEEEEDSGGSGIYFCCTLTTAKVAAHEIAHLLGAHHHYANCVEGAATKLDDTHLGTCTMMFNDVGLVNLRFSALEGAVVRGHALAYADRKPEEAKPAPGPQPQPQPSASQSPSGQPSPSPSSSSEPEEEPSSSEVVTYSRTVDLRLSGHLRATGRIDAGTAEVCSSLVSVSIERKSRGGWTRLRTKTTQADGTFRLKLTDQNGRYRAAVEEVGGHNADGAYTCGPATSTLVRHQHG
jgi:hypothetical protein